MPLCPFVVHRFTAFAVPTQLTAFLLVLVAVPPARTQSGAPLTVAPVPDAPQWVAPADRAQLVLGRPLTADDGRLAVLVADADWTGLTEVTGTTVSLQPTGRGFARGDHTVTLYLVSAAQQWQQIGQLPLRVLTAGAGHDVVNSGAVAGFPLPPLRYVVGGVRTAPPDGAAPGDLRLLTPAEGAAVPGGAVDLAWLDLPHADVYRVAIEDAGHRVVLDALVPPGIGAYRLPPFLKDRDPHQLLARAAHRVMRRPTIPVHDTGVPS